MNIRKSKKGFTLVELLVVITILAILSVTAYVAIGGQTDVAKDSKRKQDISTIQNALELTAMDGGYPATLVAIPKKYMSQQLYDPISTTASTQNYFYQTAGSEYMLATTLYNNGNEIGYVVGTDEDNSLGVGDGVSGCNLVIGSTTCRPYDLP